MNTLGKSANTAYAGLGFSVVVVMAYAWHQGMLEPGPAVVSIGVYNLTGRQPMPGIPVYARVEEGSWAAVGTTGGGGKFRLKGEHPFDLDTLKVKLDRFERVEDPTTEVTGWRADYPIFVRFAPQ